MTINGILTTALQRMTNDKAIRSSSIPWSCPILSFGNPRGSRVATLGINPSNREFVDTVGSPLPEEDRRLHTLQSLDIDSWGEASFTHFVNLINATNQYFKRNPYDAWFKKLDAILSGIPASFYSDERPACHLDLVPFATQVKWSDLEQRVRRVLIKTCGDILGMVLRESTIRVIILNGRSVVDGFSEISDCSLQPEHAPAWDLHRAGGPNVRGIAYKGLIDTVGEIYLESPILVLGYNHNLQSSFGVTNKAIHSIRAWVESEVSSHEFWK